MTSLTTRFDPSFGVNSRCSMCPRQICFRPCRMSGQSLRGLRRKTGCASWCAPAIAGCCPENDRSGRAGHSLPAFRRAGTEFRAFHDVPGDFNTIHLHMYSTIRWPSARCICFAGPSDGSGRSLRSPPANASRCNHSDICRSTVRPVHDSDSSARPLRSVILRREFGLLIRFGVRSIARCGTGLPPSSAKKLAGGSIAARAVSIGSRKYSICVPRIGKLPLTK